MIALQLKHLRKAYSQTVVPVKDISIDVAEGEFLTLLGPSGCGKSTILRLIAGLEPPTSGEVWINGREVTGKGPGDRNISMVFQSYALYPHMTVYDNISSGLRLRKLPDHIIRQRITAVSQFLGLTELMDRKPGKLSGGQRQRVAVARALVREPDVFLLDEPLSNLDALLREQVRAELKQLFSHQSVPVVYVTHDQTEAMTLSSRVAVLNKGMLQQLDSPGNIYNHPANIFVAGFIGSPQMNFVTLPLKDNQVCLGTTQLALPAGVMPSGKQVTLGLRPEHVILAQPGEETMLEGEVFLVENLGMSQLVSMKVVGAQEIAGQEVSLRGLLPVEGEYKLGDHLPLTLPLEKLHWFDMGDGRSLR